MDSRRLLPLSEYGLEVFRIAAGSIGLAATLPNRKAKRICDIIHSRRFSLLRLSILARPPDLSSFYRSCSRGNESLLTCFKSPSLYLGSDVRSLLPHIFQHLITRPLAQAMQPLHSPLPSFATPALDGRTQIAHLALLLYWSSQALRRSL